MKQPLLILLFFFGSLHAFSQNPYFYLTTAGNGYTVVEGGDLNVKVALFDASTTNVTVTITTEVDSAGAGDFTALSTTVTIPAGQLSSNTLTIPTTNDAVIEQNESFKVNATATSGNTSNTTYSLSLGILDNDAAPTLSMPYSFSLVEGQGRSVFVSLSNPFNSNIVINFTTAIGTAGSTDFTAISQSKTILAGQTSTQISVFSLQDSEVELDETFTLTGTVTSGNTANASAVTNFTIIDNDVMPLVRIADDEVDEDDEARAFISLDRAFSSNVTVQLTTSNGTAGTADYTATSTTQVIAAGQYGVGVDIPITDDTIDEPNETFNITATVTSGNTTNTSATGIVTIIDNDGLPDVGIRIYNTPTVEEGSDASFYVYLTHPSPLNTNIQLSTADGTAGNLDYTSFAANISIPAGQTSYSGTVLAVPTLLDQLNEGNETFNINAVVTSGSTYNTSTSLVVTILENYNANANADYVPSVAEVGTTFNVLANDTYHGLTATSSEVTVSVVGTLPSGITLSPQGILTVSSSLSYNYYTTLTYQICEISNPGNCDTASATVSVVAPIKADYIISYSDFNGDGYTSVGDFINYQFFIENVGNTTITNIYPDLSFSPVTVLGGPIASLAVGQIDSTTFTATHIINQDDINFGYVFDNPNLGELFFVGTYHSYEVSGFASPINDFQFQRSDGIKLNAFVDTNGNGTQQTNELNFPLGEFIYEVNTNGVIHNLYTSPFYLYESDPTTTYALDYVVDADYAAYNTTAATYSNVTVPTGSGITTYNFPITVSAYSDVSISIFNQGRPPIPGMSYNNWITFTNHSNVAIPSGTVTFIMDSALVLDEVFYANGTLTSTGTGFNYMYTDLQPYQTQYLNVRMLVPTLPTVALGQLVTNSVAISLPSGDVMPSNNNASITKTIVGSYDPNDKAESHGANIVHDTFSSDDYLTYTIQFENTGTANAINIKVEDLLDNQLDETTLKMVAASHIYTLERIGKQLIWNFFGVDLPPSEEDSNVGHGYITFKIKPQPGYAIGDVIPNGASIFFDFNPAIVTNTWTTAFVETLSTPESNLNSLTLYPNPVRQTLYLSNTAPINNVQIISILGQDVMHKDLNDLWAEIDMSPLSSGIYFVKVMSQGHEKTVKIIKE